MATKPEDSVSGKLVSNYTKQEIPLSVVQQEIPLSEVPAPIIQMRDNEVVFLIGNQYAVKVRMDKDSGLTVTQRKLR
jgi:hypothetical protein